MPQSDVTQSVLALYGFTSNALLIERFLEFTVEIFDEFGLTPTHMAFLASKYSDKTREYHKALPILKSLPTESVRHISVSSSDPNVAYPGFEYTASCLIAPKSGSYFILACSAQDINGQVRTLKRMAGMVHPSYAIGFERQLDAGPTSYALGFKYTSDATDAIDSLIAGDDDDNEDGVSIGDWTTGMDDRVFDDGMLRNVYPVNLLNDAQVAYKTDKGRFKDMVAEIDPNGLLRPVDGRLHMWIPSNRSIPKLRKALLKAKMIFSVERD